MNSMIGPEGSRPALRRFMGGRNRIFLSLFFVAILLATISFTVNDLFFARAQSTGSPLATSEQLAQLSQQLNSKIHLVGQKNNALLPFSLPAYNNAGTSNDTATTQGNFDGAGHSYSTQALALSGLTFNKTFVYDGISFLWPNPAPPRANNYVAAGQVLPLTPVANATTLGFLGAASNGASSGTAIITYTDGTTKTFSLGMSDWAQAQTSFGNTIVTSTTYGNAKAGRLNVKVSVFYASVAVDSTKVIQSVKLPSSVSKGHLHIFAVGTRIAYANLYNNVGMSDDGNPAAGNLDGSGDSYSQQAFISGSNGILAPGNTVSYGGMDFTWPDVLGGSPNNDQAIGQTMKIATPVGGIGRVGLVGAATNGSSCGTAFVNYIGGDRQSFSLCFSDWTLGALHNPASYGNIPFSVEKYLNGRSGKKNNYGFTFYTEVQVNPNEIVESVTLPVTTTGGQLHVFAVGTSAIQTDNNVGARHDNGTTYGTNLFANLDGQYDAYSIEAMHAAGFSQPDQNGLMALKFNGITFETADSFSEYPDNTIPMGQFLSYSPANLTRLAFLGAAINGPQVGTATITYTDGTTQTFQLGFNDWVSPSPLRYTNTVAATMQYINGVGGKRSVKSYLYYMQVTLDTGKTVAGLTLPSNGNMRIFGFSGA